LPSIGEEKSSGPCTGGKREEKVAHFKKYEDRQRQWRWTFYADNGEEIAVSSEGYVREADCDHGINLVKRQAANAEVRR
jgi:uncharacterized protein YegP (UPF0339 family)